MEREIDRPDPIPALEPYPIKMEPYTPYLIKTPRPAQSFAGERVPFLCLAQMEG